MKRLRKTALSELPQRRMKTFIDFLLPLSKTKAVLHPIFTALVPCALTPSPPSGDICDKVTKQSGEEDAVRNKSQSGVTFAEAHDYLQSERFKLHLRSALSKKERVLFERNASQGILLFHKTSGLFTA